jgi:DNA modification methylase
VNPYPNQWLKADRVADGHEITRFLTKRTEPFLLAGKQKKDTPILVRSDVGNVFTYNSVPPEARRHVNHKPSALLAEILSLISVPGGLGGDAGAGSGSIIEAAYNTNRKVIVAEMNEDHHVDSLSVAVDRLTHANMGADSIAPWLRAKFTT